MEALKKTERETDTKNPEKSGDTSPRKNMLVNCKSTKLFLYLQNYFTIKIQIIMDIVVQIILGLVVFFGLLFLLREFFCWYTKTNEIIKHLESNGKLLQDILNKMPEK